MCASFDTAIPKYKLYKKENYEPLLLECLNISSFFKAKSGGGFSKPESEHKGECDAIGDNKNYNIDFKCLISQDGAENMNKTCLVKKEIYPGLIISQPSIAATKGEYNLKFPDIWRFLVDSCLQLDENYKVDLKNKSFKSMNNTIASLNRIISIKKHIIYFLPTELIMNNTNDIKCIRIEAEKALSIISEARSKLTYEFETYYALLINTDKIVFLSNNFIILECFNRASLNAWCKLRKGL